MKSLSKQDIARIGDLGSELETLRGKVEDAVRELIDTHVAAVNELIATYNEKATEANGVASDIASEIETYMDERSDKWRESEKGEAYSSWLQAWQEVDFAEIDQIEVEDPSDVDTTLMNDLPTEPE